MQPINPPAGIPTPHCPHCEEELVTVGLFSWHSANGVILCVYCPNAECLKTLTFEVMPAAAMLEAKPTIQA